MPSRAVPASVREAVPPLEAFGPLPLRPRFNACLRAKPAGRAAIPSVGD